MTKKTLTGVRSQAGFTLVELAIVMIIIGLLIGGVLKGQELIGNAQVTATVAQLKGIEAATTTFKDTYATIPGDMVTPATRLPNCTVAPCATVGNGNGILDVLPTAVPTAGESLAFFIQLSVSNLLTGIVPGTNTFGGNFPQAKVNGNGILAYGSTGVAGQFPDIIGAGAGNRGLYLAVTTSPTTAPGVATVGLKPSEAARIDTKMDDSSPDAGEVRAFGTAAVTGCGTAGAAGVGGVYASNVTSAECGLYVHAQN